MAARLHRFCVLALLSLLPGCGFTDAPGKPRVMAHRAAAGLWPENSRMAVLGSLEAGYPGIEIDLALTRDAVPVLAHDAWLDPLLCRQRDGTTLPEARIYLDTLTFAELEAGYLCGGVPNPKHPAAAVFADTILSLDEYLELVRDAQGVELHFDIKDVPGRNFGPDAHAEAVLSRIHTAGLAHSWYVSTNNPEVLRAFESRGPLRTQLSWPRYDEGGQAGTSIGTELLASVGLLDLVSQARAVGADGLSTPFRLLEPHLVKAARDEGLEISTYTVDEEAALAAYCRLPLTHLITNHPERAPCR